MCFDAVVHFAQQTFLREIEALLTVISSEGGYVYGNYVRSVIVPLLYGKPGTRTISSFTGPVQVWVPRGNTAAWEAVQQRWTLVATAATTFRLQREGIDYGAVIWTIGEPPPVVDIDQVYYQVAAGVYSTTAAPELVARILRKEASLLPVSATTPPDRIVTERTRQLLQEGWALRSEEWWPPAKL